MHVIYQRPTRLLEKEQASVKRTPLPWSVEFPALQSLYSALLPIGDKKGSEKGNNWNFSSFNLLFANTALGLVSGEDGSGSRAAHKEIL